LLKKKNGFGFFKVNYLKFSFKFVNYYFITNFFWPSLSKFFPTYPFCTFPPGMINYAKKKTYSCLGWSAWWESTKWISWKEFAQTGPEKVCDKVIINFDNTNFHCSLLIFTLSQTFSRPV
jgi:hypothetical protein